ncbi:hypothetical protein ACJMK2_012977 [Sinanodonta woodiana]|uniref:BTB domain-containing protein n=1 Tax=Sinanodonta woodiana TaxID=1069815 RepID=A0ABD3VB35_SINWO
MDQLHEIDWQSRKSIAECNRQMLTKQIETDITFLVGEHREPIKAHKYVLRSRSCVFYTMFYGPLHNSLNEIRIVDIEPEIFKQVLLFIYCEDIIIDLNNVHGVLDMAKKFSIQSLIDMCLRRLKVSMSTHNICTILENAHLYNDVQLKEKCLKFIFHQPKAVFQNSDLSELSENSMTEIIKSDDLALSEQEIYEGLQRYAHGKCQKHGIEPTTENKKHMLGGLLQHVRFPSMNREYFTDVVFESGFLPQEEELKLLQHFVEPQQSINGFSMEKRKFRCLVNRFNEHATGWGYKRDKSDAIMFSVSKNILIHGVTVYGCCQGAGKYEVSLAIKEAPYNVDKAIKKQQLETDSSEKMYNIYFDAPILIEKNKQYNIILCMKGPGSYYGVKGRTEIDCEGVQFKFKKSTLSVNTTDEVRGQLPGIVFEIFPEET